MINHYLLRYDITLALQVGVLIAPVETMKNLSKELDFEITKYENYENFILFYIKTKKKYPFLSYISVLSSYSETEEYEDY